MWLQDGHLRHKSQQACLAAQKLPDGITFDKLCRIWQPHVREVQMVVRIRNGINHLILHLLLKCKYRVRRRPQAVRCIVAAETLCIKIGLIYYGRRNL